MLQTKLGMNKKPNFTKLAEYGFRKGDEYCWSTDIMGGLFCVTIYVCKDGQLKVKVFDKETEEEYTLVYVADSAGKFVGQVREECQQLLQDIVETCYEPDVFKYRQTLQVIRYIWEKYGAVDEHLWENSPENAIFRYEKTKKWFAVLIALEAKKLGLDREGMIEILNLKAKPEWIAENVDGEKYLKGFHMNKKHWFTICLDGSVPLDEICQCIDESYRLVVGK